MILSIIGATGIAIVGVVLLVWAERAEDRERQKLANYRRAESLQKARGKFVTVEYYPRGI